LTDPDSIRRGIGPECSTYAVSAEAGLCRRNEFSDEFDGSILFEQALVLKRAGRAGDADHARPVITNVPHLVVHHSPDGYEFGYGGSGPADLALNICQLYLNIAGYQGRTMKCYDGSCWMLAYSLRHEFKERFIANAPHEGWTIPFTDIDAWFRQKITLEMVEQYAEVNAEG
jgi:hypothetical protein